MLQENICLFVPFRNDQYSIHTINFVFEKKQKTYEKLKIDSVYKMYYVCSGQGKIHTEGKVTPLREGDLFFTFPATSFAIESVENFTFMYISFLGHRGNKLMESLRIGPANFIFHDAGEIYYFWKKGLQADGKVIDLMSEAILLYTFSFLGNRLLPEKKESKQNHILDRIKKYIDDHFSQHHFSLDSISRDLSYNKKYISYVFKKQTGTGIVEYLNTIRIQNACTMIEQGFTSVTDIADRCGYSDAQYFSKIFKSKMGVSPTQHIKAVQEKKAE